MKVLVTGATGFIGNYVIKELLKHKVDIIATSSNYKKAKQQSWFENVNYISFDFSQFDSVINYFQFFHQPDILIHLAWEGLPNYNSSFHTEINLPRHKALLENLICNGLKDITVTGTCLEYGMQEGCLSEEMPAFPSNPYSIAKDGLRKYIEHLQNEFLFSFKWVRLFYMYGKGQNENSLLSQLDKALQNGNEVFNMSGGEQTRDYLPVSRVAEKVVQLAVQDNVEGIINCCNGIPITVKAFVEHYLKEAGKSIKLNLGYYPYTDYEPMHFWGSTEKIKEGFILVFCAFVVLIFNQKFISAKLLKRNLHVNRKKFSIILPVKNGGEYVKQCVQSILTQTYPGFDLHILENCSNDGTAEWLQTLLDEHIIIIPSEKPLSIEENWARILSINKNEFMTIIGHDDLLDKDYLQTMNELINQHPDASLYQTHFRFIDAKGNFIRHCKPMDEKQTAAEFLHALFVDSIDTMGTGYMLRSKDYNLIGGIPLYPNLLFADHVLWIRMTSLNYKATSEKENFSYRLHNNLSKKSGAVSYINAFYNYMDFLISYKTNHHQSATIIKEYICPYILYYCHSLSHRLLKTPLKERNEITVSGFINNCTKYNSMLASTHSLNPLQQSNIRYAKFIDDNLILRSLYLLFRKFYNKPIYS